MSNLKKVLFLLLIIFIICTGCDNNENKEIVCTKKEGDIQYTATITREDGTIIVKHDEVKEECIGDSCSYTANSEEEVVDDFNKAVEKEKKEGYSCE